MATSDEEYGSSSSSLEFGQASASGVGGVVTVMLHGLWTVFCVGSPDASITSAVKETFPATAGVPLISPVEGLRASPVGKVPVLEKTYGG